VVAAPATDRVHVTHAGGAYDVVVRAGILRDLATHLAAIVPGRRVAALADAAVVPHLHEWIGESAPWHAIHVLPSGEASKTRTEWARLSDELLASGMGRDGAIVAIGGGVTGDLAGFVAATLLRGLPYVHVPTTTVAMLDSSVGGKTGVDTVHGKNLIGAFHPPVGVLIDPLTLQTLPERHYRAGLAEAVKHGLIRDAAYFDSLERDVERLGQRDADAVTSLVARSVAIKAAVVQADEFERGERATLNAGHTIGHAIEHASAYALLHGECVALGLLAECAIAEQLAGLDPEVRVRLSTLLARLGLPVHLTLPLTDEMLLAAMRHDKKNRAGLVRCALPTALGTMGAGDGSFTQPVSEALLTIGLAAIRP
jgi:3-dehydroquinate synthase